MSRTTELVPAALAAAVLSQACDDPLKQPQLIEETRVIGAQAQVVDHPGRAWPRPDEMARVRWLVAYPGEPEPVSWAFRICPAVDVAFGIPQCSKPPFFSSRSERPTTEEPTIEFSVPAELATDEVGELAVLGVVCTEGTPALADSLEASGCEGGAGRPVSFTIGVQLGEQTNHNPDLATAPFSLDGNDWMAADALASDCAEAPEAPVVAPGTGHTIAFELSDSDREPLDAQYDFDETTEAIQISQFATGGHLERAYTVVEADMPNRVELSWKAPVEVSARGQLVRFYFVARDPRGGADWGIRALCVMP